LTITLINEGYEVESVFDGKTALEKIKLWMVGELQLI
jgi:hypothetical protein